MIDLPAPLQKVMQSANLDALKPFAVLFRNKWYEESDGEGYFALDTANPVDITAMLEKPNTLSMTLDVNEVAQYKANNVTLTLSDPFNKFVEGTAKSFFNNGYQIYGSQVVLYYGLDSTNRTPLFVGVIKDMPSYKPEQYQVDVKLISPLELLNDIEAKEFSDKYEGETLTANGYDSDNNPIFKTAHNGVGGFYAIYAGETKLFEGVDFSVSQLSMLGSPALVTIKNALYQAETITADYYCWKKGLSVEQIVSGLVALGGYINNTNIKAVVWNTGLIKNISSLDVSFAIGFTKEDLTYTFNWYDTGTWDYVKVINDTPTYTGYKMRKSIFPNEFTINFILDVVIWRPQYNSWIQSSYAICDEFDTMYKRPKNGYMIYLTQEQRNQPFYIKVQKWVNNTAVSIEDVYSGYYKGVGGVQVKNGNVYFFDTEGNLLYQGEKFFTPAEEAFKVANTIEYTEAKNIVFSPDVSSFIIGENAEKYNKPVIRSKTMDKTSEGFWGSFTAQFQDLTNLSFLAKYASSNENINIFNNWTDIDLGQEIGEENRFACFSLQFTNDNVAATNIIDPQISYYGNTLNLQIVNLTGRSVLQALQDLALISGYEFGVDRQGVFFFRPRSQSTTPIYDLEHDEIVQVNSISKKISDVFTKLTLQFSQTPLEFYANEGERPTPIDRYGVINKEISKPDIVNYDNPELAQAIGPQLLALYSDLRNIIQCTAKLNLALELGDIINLKRSYTLTAPTQASDITKYLTQQTYFRACKITGINYNFSRRQVTYTLRDVSNDNNKPQYEFNEYIYDYAVPFGVKE